jgi:hypothetical protein
MKLLQTALFTFIIATGSHAKAQTADEIINKNIDATGGKEKLSQVKTIYMEGEMEIMGNKAPSLTYIVDGKGYKTDVDFNGAKIITCYTDTSGWTMNPMAGQTVPTPVSEEVLKSGKLQLDVTGPLFNYAAKGNKVELLGKEGGAYKLKVTPPSSTDILFFIDTASYQVLKTVTNITANGQQIEISVENSDFRKTEFGTIMPYSMKIDFPGLTIINTSNKIEVNKEIDKAVFEMPKH